ncbi:hypothetical protein [Nocardioides yefusunii]|uniref:SMODS and SLOG-associating 2TM effector domain-containing protein n=1 Tax=Nocardioides yefusunii TaxID=2500546 RepID=A0ABW1QUJ2_9ACTN|nr:hypothetical protein [Nocardioides yefusunii]
MTIRLLSLALTATTLPFAANLASDFSWTKAAAFGLTTGVLATLLGAVVRRREAARPLERTHQAYLAAWSQRTDDGSIDVLRESFKQHSAPGAYVDPDGEALAPWIEAWHEGLAPQEARRSVRQAG